MLETNEIKTGEETTVKAVGSYWAELGRFFLLAVIIIVPLRFLLAEPFIVSGCSMFPTFDHREYIIVDKVSYWFHKPNRGDVVVMRYPLDESQYFIKRIVGLPGDTVTMESGGVRIVNPANLAGFKLEETYLSNQVQTYGDPIPHVLKEGEYFVLGDNRTASNDSRVWGALPKKDIVGKAFLRLVPVDRLTLFTHSKFAKAAPAIESKFCK